MYQTPEGSAIPTEGIFPEVVGYLQGMTGLGLEYICPPDKEYGMLKTLENGTSYWSGIVGQVNKKK